ncbi:serine/threonine-protein kinase [Aeromicrobium chenweiae]|nr:serine/threonine-protein kinase [Aeromicrobium chenweiae]
MSVVAPPDTDLAKTRPPSGDPDAHRAARTGSPEPRRVGPYAIGREIGRGVTSIVSAARHLGLGRGAAFKELHVRTGSPVLGAALFREEARILGSLDHANVVAVHDLVDQDGVLAIVMERASGGTLRSCIQRGLREDQAGAVLADILAGLAHLGGRGVVHLDIKPSNLLISHDGTVKIADFGIAQALEAQDVVSAQNTVQSPAGTPHYLAPEQVLPGWLGPWTDLYAVGITAFELLAGRSPFADITDPVEVVERQIHERVPPVCDLVPGVSHEMSEWVSWLVSKAPAHRPQNAAEAWYELDRLLSDRRGPHWRDGAALTRRPAVRP